MNLTSLAIYVFLVLTNSISWVGLVLINLFQYSPTAKWYYKDVLFFVTGASVLLGALTVISLLPFTVGKRWKHRDLERVSIRLF